MTMWGLGLFSRCLLFATAGNRKRTIAGKSAVGWAKWPDEEGFAPYRRREREEAKPYTKITHFGIYNDKEYTIREKQK